ncbi:type II toxin-antitoxin system PemK/MazF family toxin [Paenibacillus sp. O199]|uniref:type II toxin-antitoxin system PemK/MazF family toxin n=1 Tax=Paenibacillus sp. O199 TaxID=1643925 RepID=UPI0019671278|nr:type II toxin-antitoxin system PemK/MazF family toxin [Paenibacillus sp. O199]
MEVWNVDLGKGEDHVQGGVRPCLVVSNDIGNRYSPVVIIAPLTSSKIKKPMPTHVYVDAESCGMYSDSTILFEQILTIPKKKLEFKIFDMPKIYFKKIEKAMQISLSMSLT